MIYKKKCTMCGRSFKTTNERRDICYRRVCRANRHKEYHEKRRFRNLTKTALDSWRTKVCPYEAGEIKFDGFDWDDPKITPLENHWLPEAVKVKIKE